MTPEETTDVQNVLIVEDDSATRHLVRGLLEAQGYRVEVAEDGDEALVRLAAQRFDLLLVDVWMPGMNGLDLIARLGSEQESPRVVVLTADETPDTVLKAIRARAWRYVKKPVEPRTLIHMVQKALASAPPPRPIQVISAKADWVELLIPCERESAERVQSFLAHLNVDLSDELRTTVGQAFRELLMNAVEWGGQFDPSRDVRISCVRARRALFYRIADPGHGFKLDELKHSAVNNPEDRPTEHVEVREKAGIRAGGFGILMARALVDELIYNEAHNEVLLVKYLE